MDARRRLERRGPAADGVPPLNHIALRWFDHYLKGIDTHSRATIPKVTQYVYGDEKYEMQADWPQPEPAARPAATCVAGRQLPPDSADRGRGRPTSFLQQPLSGICTQRTSQWTAGLARGPAVRDRRPARRGAGGASTYTTPPVEQDLRLSGPVRGEPVGDDHRATTRWSPSA